MPPRIRQPSGPCRGRGRATPAADSRHERLQPLDRVRRLLVVVAVPAPGRAGPPAAQWFHTVALDKRTGYLRSDHAGKIEDLRTRLIYQNTGRFKLIETIPAGTDRLRDYSIFIYRVVTAAEFLADRVAGRPPAIRSIFDVYFLDDSLVYAKEQCVPEDVEAKIFLHVDAIDPDDLPSSWRRDGFDNLDFRFDDRRLAERRSLRGGVEVSLLEYGKVTPASGHGPPRGTGRARRRGSDPARPAERCRRRRRAGRRS